jgi:hypothetical protein
LNTRPLKRIENNHSGYLEVLLKELRKLSDLGGTLLNCEVSYRQILWYLSELHNLRYVILKNINQDPDSLTGHSVRVVERDHNTDLHQFNMFSELEYLKHEINSARLLIMDIIRQLRMDEIGISIPLTMQILIYRHEDAIKVSHHTLALSESLDAPYSFLH